MNFNIARGRFVLFLFAASLFMSGACTAQGRASQGRAVQDQENSGRPQTGLETRTIRIAAAAGEVSLEAELAQTDDQRMVGLMYRTVLEDGKGMLFIFDHDEVLSFWMKNTLIPLSIAFITYDGKILEIKDMQPEALRSVESSRMVRYALEVPQGWFDRAGIQAGDAVSGL
jgi:uncharacterized membrane protein (UPF0127 family)